MLNTCLGLGLCGQSGSPRAQQEGRLGFISGRISPECEENVNIFRDMSIQKSHNLSQMCHDKCDVIFKGECPESQRASAQRRQCEKGPGKVRTSRTASAHDHVAKEALRKVPMAKGEAVPSGLKCSLSVRA